MRAIFQRLGVGLPSNSTNVTTEEIAIHVTGNTNILSVLYRPYRAGDISKDMSERYGCFDFEVAILVYSKSFNCKANKFGALCDDDVGNYGSI